MSEALQALLAYQQADEDGVMVLTSRQAIHEVAEHYEKLRRTLEGHAVRNRGGPFWRCEYCQALSQTPIAFKHKPECVMVSNKGPPVVTDGMVDAALNAWFASPPSETDQGLERSMRSALETALGAVGWHREQIDREPDHGQYAKSR